MFVFVCAAHRWEWSTLRRFGTHSCLTVLILQAREHILKIHSRKMNLMRGINLRRVAEKMTTCSGAECKVRAGGA